MLNIHDFIAAISVEFDEAKPEQLLPETPLRGIAGWSSMLSLIIVAKIKKLYHVQISAKELSEAVTLNDLYQLVIQKSEA